MSSANQPPVGACEPSNGSWRGFAVVGLLVLLSGGGYWMRMTRNVPMTSERVLFVPDGALDFGHVWRQPNLSWKIPVRNISAREVRILDIESSCNCAEPEPCSLTIAPGDTKTVVVALNLGSSPAETDDPLDWAFVAYLRPIVASCLSNDRVWALRGEVRSPFTVVENGSAAAAFQVRLSEPFRLGNHQEGIVLTLRKHELVEDILVKSHPSWASVSLEPMPDDSTKMRLRMTPNPQMPVGPFSFEIVTSCRVSGEPLTIPHNITLLGEVETDLEMLPSSLAFGVQLIGHNISEKVVLRSRAGKPFEVVFFVSRTSNTRVRQLTTSSAAEHVFEISQAVSRVGQCSTTVEFHMENTGRPDLPNMISLPVSHYGLKEHR